MASPNERDLSVFCESSKAIFPITAMIPMKIDWKPLIVFRPCEVPEKAERSVMEGTHEMHLNFINLPGKFAQYKPAGKRRPRKIEVYHGDSEDGKAIVTLLPKA